MEKERQEFEDSVKGSSNNGMIYTRQLALNAIYLFSPQLNAKETNRQWAWKSKYSRKHTWRRCKGCLSRWLVCKGLS